MLLQYDAYNLASSPTQKHATIGLHTDIHTHMHTSSQVKSRIRLLCKCQRETYYILIAVTDASSMI